jgi:flagellar biosynthesis/type III secretory pathway chaperone
MNAALRYLVNVLEQEIRHAQNVFSFLKEKEKALVEGDSRNLGELVVQEHALFVRSRELEVNRLSAVEAAAGKHGLPLAEATLSRLGTLPGFDPEGRLDLLRGRLIEWIQKIRVQNQKCERLLKKSLEIVRFSMQLLSGTHAVLKKPLYNRQCRAERGAPARTLVDKRG